MDFYTPTRTTSEPLEGGGGDPLHPSSQTSGHSSLEQSEPSEPSDSDSSTGTSVEQGPFDLSQWACHVDRQLVKSGAEDSVAPSEGPTIPFEDVIRRRKDLDEKDRIQQDIALDIYEKTGDARVFEPILAPFMEEGELKWTWKPEAERWYCEGSRVWCPTLESFS